MSSVPNPQASVPNPQASVPNPQASVPNPQASVPNPQAPVQSLPSTINQNPIPSIFNPGIEYPLDMFVPNRGRTTRNVPPGINSLNTISVRSVTTRRAVGEEPSMLTSQASVPNPQASVPNPQASVPNPQAPLPNQQASVSIPQAPVQSVRSALNPHSIPSIFDLGYPPSLQLGASAQNPAAPSAFTAGVAAASGAGARIRDEDDSDVLSAIPLAIIGSILLGTARHLPISNEVVNSLQFRLQSARQAMEEEDSNEQADSDNELNPAHPESFLRRVRRQVAIEAGEAFSSAHQTAVDRVLRWAFYRKPEDYTDFADFLCDSGCSTKNLAGKKRIYEHMMNRLRNDDLEGDNADPQEDLHPSKDKPNANKRCQTEQDSSDASTSTGSGGGGSSSDRSLHCFICKESFENDPNMKFRCPPCGHIICTDCFTRYYSSWSRKVLCSYCNREFKQVNAYKVFLV